MLSEASRKVIEKALERHRRRMEEVEAIGWYRDSTPTQGEIKRIDTALAELAALPQMPEWKPVGSDALIKCACGDSNCEKLLSVDDDGYTWIGYETDFGEIVFRLPLDVRLCRPDPTPAVMKEE